jgi:hypothetical protein
MNTLNTILTVFGYKLHCYNSFNSINGNGMVLDYMNSAKEWKGPRIIGHFEDLTDGKHFKMSYVAEANFIKVSFL